MDEKTRSNFELNIWGNPAATMSFTENQIYERCEDLLDSENHYCTPISSRQTSGTSVVSSTLPLTSTSSKSSFQYNPSKKWITLILICVMLFAISIAALGCGVSAIIEIQKLNDKLGNLEGKIDRFEQFVREDSAKLNESILTESEKRLINLEELENRLEQVIDELSKETQANFTSLTSNIQEDLAQLGGAIRENLALISNMSAMDFRELTSEIQMNFSEVSNFLDQFHNETQINFDDLKSRVHFEIIELDNKIVQNVQELANLTDERIKELNLTTKNEIREIEENLFALGMSVYDNITLLTTRTKGNFEELTSRHVMDINRVESELSTHINTLRMDVAMNRRYAESNITVLQNEIQQNISNFEIETSDSISVLTDELNRVESELAQTVQVNISQLDTDLQEKLNELTIFVHQSFNSQETEIQAAITNLSDGTNHSLRVLEMQTFLNLTSVLEETSYNFSQLTDQTQLQIEQLESIFQMELSDLTTQLSQNLTEVSILTQLRIVRLDNDTKMALNKLTSVDNQTLEYLNSIQLELSSNINNTRQSIEENLHQLSVNFQTRLSELSSNDSQIFNHLQVLDSDIANIILELHNVINGSIQTLISDTTNLSTILTMTRFNIMHELQSVNMTLQGLRLSTNTSVILLQNHLEQLAADTLLNITKLENMTLIIEESLSDLANDTQNEINSININTEMSISDVKTELYSNLSKLEFDILIRVDQVNSTLNQEIQSLSLETMNITTSFMKRVTDSINIVYSYVNSTAMDIWIEMSNLNYIVLNINSSLDDTIINLEDVMHDQASGYLVLREVQENLTELIRFKEEIQRMMERIDANTRQAANDLISLESQTRENLTEVQNFLLHSLRGLENVTQSSLVQHRVEVDEDITDVRSELAGNISTFSTHLNDIIQYFNVSVSSMIQTSSNECQKSVISLAQITQDNFTFVYDHIYSVTSQTSTLLMGFVSNNTDKINILDSITNTLESGMQELRSELTAAQQNVLSVINETEIIQSSIEAIANSSVDLYGRCIQDVMSCSVTLLDTDYQTGCITDSIPTNIKVSNNTIL